MLILWRLRALELLLFCCVQANHYNAANSMELETEVLNRARNGQICLPGIQDLVEGKIPNIQQKQKEIWDYMATVPQFGRQDSVFKQTSGEPRPVEYTSFGHWEQSQMESMKGDFLLIKEDLKNLLWGKLADGTFFHEDVEPDLMLEIKKFQSHVNELNSIHTSILKSIQLKIFQSELTKKESHQFKNPPQKDAHVSHDIPTSSKGRMTEPTFRNISRDEIQVIEEHIPRLLAKDLNKLLDKIPFKLNDKANTSDHETFTAIRLQSIIFQTINYLYKYNLIPKEDIIDLFGSKQKLNLAATNMVLIFKINAEFGIRRPISFDGAYILRSHLSSHFRNMFKVLGANQNRYIQYVCFKLVCYHHIEEDLLKRMGVDNEEDLKSMIHFFLEDERLFNILEQDLQSQSLSELQFIQAESEDAYEMEFKKKIEDVKDGFLDPNHPHREIANLTIQFFILNFIQENYESVFLKLCGNDISLQQRMGLLKSNFQLLQELRNMTSYFLLIAARISSQPRDLKMIEKAEYSRQKFIKEAELLSSHMLIILARHDHHIAGFLDNHAMRKYLMLLEINWGILEVKQSIIYAHECLNQ